MSKFCYECGAQLFEENAKFCSICGAKTVKDEETTQILPESRKHENLEQCSWPRCLFDSHRCDRCNKCFYRYDFERYVLLKKWII